MATALKDAAGVKGAAPGDAAHPFAALRRGYVSGDERVDAAVALAHRGPSGLPWLSATTSAKVR
ncbi:MULTISPECIES: hypothetical protein [unclassified Streptomyces]|uniref:hypothetical protein n=1 Tax=unclassified Streptomyces TaxID=2593676 RepID=UPI00278BC625|nr:MULTISPECIES: hypothetical protein [unclassified Streptomyces]